MGSWSTLSVSDTAVFEEFLDQFGGPLVALWATVLLALLAGAILLSLVQPWGRRPGLPGSPRDVQPGDVNRSVAENWFVRMR